MRLWLLGAVFLCTTGAEALYSRPWPLWSSNIRVSWVYVKSCLFLNYLGQGARYWLITMEGLRLQTEVKEQLGINAFYDLMPQWFIILGVVIATTAAIIASQAMISGSFTLISEAMRLNLMAKIENQLSHPKKKGSYLFLLSTLSVSGMCGRGTVF